MGKHTRKRQKTEKTIAEVQPLGSAVSLLDDVSKDDEERRLESMLFGTAYVPAPDAEENLLVRSDDEQDDALGGDAELQNLLDTDLFFVDDSAPNRASNVLDADLSTNLSQDVDDDEEDDDTDDEEVEEDKEVQNAEVTAPPPIFGPPKTRKGPAWTDPDDTTLQVSLAADKRLRKLRDAPSDDTVGGREYERRLRRQYEKINPTPEWAANARKKLRPTKTKRRRSSVSSSATDFEEDGLPELLTSTDGILERPLRSKTLPQGTLAIERLRDANMSAQAEGSVKAVQFHPSPQVPVLLTASADRRLRLFNVDGHTNPHLHTVHIPALPITNALFHPSGSSVLVTGPRPFYYTYDLQSGTVQRSERGLWGTTFNNNNPSAQDASMEISAFDPTGEVLAVAGRRGYVHLVDWKSGAGQVVGSVKMNAGVKSLWWSKGESGVRPELLSLGEDAEVYVWDVGERKCVRRWRDDGGFGSGIIGGDRAGKYVAVGSRTGLVNVYGSEGPSSYLADRPKPLKAIGNLTTSITTMRFNHDSQLLAIASNVKKDQMRLIHLPSLTAFSNWPTSSTPLGHVTSIDFSTGSEYVAVGNNRGRVLLYHLKDFVA